MQKNSIMIYLYEDQFYTEALAICKVEVMPLQCIYT